MVRRITACAFGVLLALCVPIGLAAQGGGVQAQIQAALRAFTRSANTWTGTQTFQNVTVNGTCTGCGGGGGISFADLATPPTNTALGSSVAPFGAAHTAFLHVPFGGDISTADVYIGSPANLFNAGVQYQLANDQMTIAFYGTKGPNRVGSLQAIMETTDAGSASVQAASYSSGFVTHDGSDWPSAFFGIAGNTGSNAFTGASVYGGAIYIEGTGDISEAIIFRAFDGGQDSGSGNIQTQIGFRADALVGGVTSNIGFKSLLDAGAGQFAFYGAGTAPSVFGGTVTATDFIVSGSRFKSDTTNAHTGGLAVYDIDGAVYKDFIVWTNANAPAVVLSTPAGGTFSGDFSTLTVNGVPVSTTLPLLQGTTASIGGGLLAAAGSCATGTATVTGAVVGKPVFFSTSDGTAANSLVSVYASVTATNTVTLQECALAAVTPAAKTWNVSVQQ